MSTQDKNEDTTNYKAAYLRQKLAREKAESLLESRSSELYDTHQSLMAAYNKLKNQKSQMFHQEKLASIGQLSAGVAHEINNPAGYVKSNLASLKRYIDGIKGAINDYNELIETNNINTELTDKIAKKYDLEYILEDIDDLVGESINGLSRIESIVKSLKNFARPDADEPISFNINNCVEDTLKLVQKEITQKAHLNTELKSSQLINGQPGNISQVILNLLVNALQAIPTNGQITVTTSDVGNEVCLCVEDNGSGIDNKNLKKIFDPFFSTKDIGVGTGLGLSVSHGIIKKHNGRINVESTLGKGSRFYVYLPSLKP